MTLKSSSRLLQRITVAGAVTTIRRTGRYVTVTTHEKCWPSVRFWRKNMPGFLTNLILDPQPDRKWRVVFPFVYESDIAGVIQVPADFVSDLNSIPRFLWWASTPTDFPEAGVIHDYLYAMGCP